MITLDTEGTYITQVSCHLVVQYHSCQKATHKHIYLIFNAENPASSSCVTTRYNKHDNGLRANAWLSVFCFFFLNMTLLGVPAGFCQLDTSYSHQGRSLG